MLQKKIHELNKILVVEEKSIFFASMFVAVIDYRIMASSCQRLMGNSISYLHRCSYHMLVTVINYLYIYIYIYISRHLYLPTNKS